MAAQKKMPGPGLLSSIAYGFDFRKNYLSPLDRLWKQYGDYISIMGIGVDVIMAFHPDAVEHVLKTNGKNYTKAPDLRELEPVLGKGLLTSEGDLWKEHRRIIAPEFQHKKVDGFYPIMAKHLGQLIRTWQGVTGVTDVAPAISRTTYMIAGECFFGANVEETADVVYHGIETTSDVAIKRMASPLKFPRWLPLPSHRRSDKAMRDMDNIVFKIIDARMANPSDANDMMSRLIRGANGGQLDRTAIRDEVMTMLLAGHETTANALSWTLYLLGQHQDIQDKLRDEISSVVGGEVPTLEELRKLAYTKMVFEESMRLFPPAAIIGRAAIEGDVIGGYEIKPKTIVNLAQWITHRHPDFWSQPNEFIPERFAKPGGHHPFAYFPFAAGPRECVGKNMAMVEAIALLAGMIKNFRFQLSNEKVSIRPLITLRPHPGVFMTLTPAKVEGRIGPEAYT